MPLPEIAVPKHSVTIPSTGKQTTFRPFLVKEQKVLFVALESKDEKQMVKAMSDIVQGCVDGVEDASSLPLFDLEYLFVKIRSKSVGETVDVVSRCPECKESNQITVNLDEIEVKFPEGHSSRIMLTDKLGVMLRYPSISDTTQGIENMDSSSLIRYISDCIEMVFDEDQTYGRKDFTQQEAVKFVDSLTTEQFERLSSFYRTMPHVHKEVAHKCERCGREYEVEFKGMRDFFT